MPISNIQKLILLSFVSVIFIGTTFSYVISHCEANFLLFTAYLAMQVLGPGWKILFGSKLISGEGFAIRISGASIPDWRELDWLEDNYTYSLLYSAFFTICQTTQWTLMNSLEWIPVLEWAKWRIWTLFLPSSCHSVEVSTLQCNNCGKAFYNVRKCMQLFVEDDS